MRKISVGIVIFQAYITCLAQLAVAFGAVSLGRPEDMRRTSLFK